MWRQQQGSVQLTATQRSVYEAGSKPHGCDATIRWIHREFWPHESNLLQASAAQAQHHKAQGTRRPPRQPASTAPGRTRRRTRGWQRAPSGGGSGTRAARPCGCPAGRGSGGGRITGVASSRPRRGKQGWPEGRWVPGKPCCHDHRTRKRAGLRNRLVRELRRRLAGGCRCKHHPAMKNNKPRQSPLAGSE